MSRRILLGFVGVTWLIFAEQYANAQVWDRYAPTRPAHRGGDPSWQRLDSLRYGQSYPEWDRAPAVPIRPVRQLVANAAYGQPWPGSSGCASPTAYGPSGNGGWNEWEYGGPNSMPIAPVGYAAANYPPALTYPNYPAPNYPAPNYPAFPSGGQCPCPQNDPYYVGYGLFGQPRAFSRNEPLRNFFRYLLP